LVLKYIIIIMASTSNSDLNYLVLVGSVQHGVSHVGHSGLVAILEERLRAELRARLRLLVVLQLRLETDLEQIKQFIFGDRILYFEFFMSKNLNLKQIQNDYYFLSFLRSYLMIVLYFEL
jgi:hypothetical protein